MLLNDSGNDIEVMVDSRKAFDPTTTAFHTGFHQAETHRIVDPSTEKQMKQSLFYSLARSSALPWWLHCAGHLQSVFCFVILIFYPTL